MASTGDLGALNGWVPAPNDAWHQDISGAPVDPNSATIVSAPQDLNGAHLHPDFSTPADGGAGIPYTVVDTGATPIPLVSITPYDSYDSDNTLYPFFPSMPIEGNPSQCWSDGADHHAIVIDKNGCVAYEAYQANLCNGSWSSYGNIIWDLSTTEQRPYGMSSTDAAGLSIFEGLVRYDEIVSGSINHAIRFTATHTKADNNGGYYTAPAVHAAGNLWGTDNIMGERIRLKADFDISGFSTTNQIILKAMKKYGMILADNGGNMFFQGTPDPRWNDNDLNALKVVPATAFEVVKMGPVYDGSTAPTGPAPVINSFTASSSTVSPGSSVTLTSNVTNGSYQFIDNAGFTRGSITVKPTQTTTYTLYTRNQYGTSTATTTVTVSANSNSTPSLNFAAIPTQTFGVSPFTVSASSKSSGAITYSVVSGPATVSGNVVTVTGVGTVTLQASQAAAGSYTSATATTSFVVNGQTPTISFASIANKSVGAAPFTVSATSNSSGAITYSVVSGPATISGNTVSVTGAGTVTLLASQAANGNFTTGTATTSFTVSASSSTNLAFAAIPAQTFGASVQVAATSNSPGAITYSVVSGPATISGNTVTVTGTGTVTVGASQAASGSYAAATVTTTFTANPAAPKLSFTPVASVSTGAAPFTVSATSNSSGAITYAVVSGPATISGNTVTVTGAGTVTLQASQAANGNFTSATATTSFTVAAANTSTLAFAAIPAQTYGASFQVSATSKSPGAITYGVVSGPASIAGNTVTVTGTGTVTLQASQAATAAYPASTATASFVANPAAPKLFFNPTASVSTGAAPFTVSATSNSTGAITYAVVSGPATISGNVVTVTGAGTVTLVATQAATTNYTGAQVTATITVVASATKPNLSVSVVRTKTAYVAVTSSNSPGTITLSIVSGPAHLSGNNVVLTGSGTVTVMATQAASGNYSAATATTSFN